MNKQEKALRLAKEKGYYVDKEGKVFSNNKELVLRKIMVGITYLSFNIRTEEKHPTRLLVHRLQAFQKFGDKIFEKGIVTRHKDGDSLNNSEDNILIGSQSENMFDKSKEQRIQDASNPYYNHKSIIEDRKNGMTYKNIMLKYNISSKGTVSFIVNKSLEIQK